MHKNILIITIAFRPNIGGLETHLNDLCEYLRQHENRVFVVTYMPLMTKAQAPGYEKIGRLEIYRLPWFGYNWYHRLEHYPPLLFLYLVPGLLIASIFFLIRHRKDIDIIHAQGYMAGFIAKILKILFGIKTVVTLHALFEPLYGLKGRPNLSRVLKWVISSADGIVALARKSKSELVELGLPEEKIEVCTHWVDLERFKPIDHLKGKEELHWNGRFIVLFVGRLIKIKGAELLLNVAQKVHHGIDFVLIGDGPLNERIAEASLKQKNVIYLGKVSNKDIPAYYNAADLFVIPSLYDELFGRVVIEALACGTPVAASSKGSLPEVINDSVGWIVEPTVEAFADTINYAYENQQMLEKMRTNCRTYAEACFSEKNAEVITALYENLV